MMSLAYRPDIDGLRAIAVGSVVLFHGGFSPFRGGFVGVDVFFVISGFLITSIMVGDIERGRFSLIDFYDRRIRRILPALFVVLLATVVLSVFILLPKQMSDLGESLIPAVLFFANVYFMHQQSYFAPAAEALPLLHLWSLAVEEQFYIIFPLVLFALMRIGGRRLAVGGLLLVALGSLVLAQMELQEAPRRAFFLLSSRAWELLAGSLLALAPLPALRTRIAMGLGLVGLAALLLPIFAYTRDTPFPGVAALPPVLGAVLLIYSGRHAPAGPVARLLSHSGMVYVGRISYSLYLWHWPLLALAYAYRDRRPTAILALALISAAVVLAALSLRYVEMPARRANWFKGLRVAHFGAAAVGILLFIGCAQFLTNREGFLWPISPLGKIADAAMRVSMFKDVCVPSADFGTGSDGCTISPPGAEGTYDVLVWGDSHASASFSGFSALLAREGVGTRLLALRGCPPLIGISTPRETKWGTDCAIFNTAVIEEIEKHPPKLVVLVGRWALWTTYAAPTLALTMPDLPDARLPTGDGSRAAFPVALRRTVEAIRRAGSNVLLVAQAPEFPIGPAACTVRAEHFGGDSSHCLVEGLDVVTRISGANTAELQKVAREVPGTEVVELAGLFCDEKSCHAADDAHFFFSDSNHLSRSGAGRIMQSPIIRETILALLGRDARVAPATDPAPEQEKAASAVRGAEN
ncbi:acyltransferase family protein [Xanthobacter variabilis]|uniref:acyltransferase family protein n=1 Tax=Xanthobacter variabilis TaxID=3119932 RepID=UPI003729A89F